MPLTAAQLQELIDQAGTALQAIQSELGRDRTGGRVRFPTGYIKPVRDRIGGFIWMDSDALKRNICYHLIFTDVLRWLLNRTTLMGTAQSMVIKHIIVAMGTVAEAVTFTAARQLGHGKRSFIARIERLRKEGVLTEALRGELEWLWQARAAIHVHEVVDLELDAYEVRDSNRAIRAVTTLNERVRNFVIALDFEVLE
jgi:hypothetical protein